MENKGVNMIIKFDKPIHGIEKVHISKPNKKYTEDEVRESIERLVHAGFLIRIESGKTEISPPAKHQGPQ